MVLLFLLLLVSFVIAGGMEDFFDIWKNYELISVLIVAVAIVLIAIIYQVGKVIGDKKVCDWARYEAFQGIGTLVIIALIAIALNMTNVILLASMSEAGFSCKGTECSYIEYNFTPTLTRYDNVSEIKRTCTADCHLEIAKVRLNATYDLVRHYIASKVNRAGWITLISTIRIHILGVEFEPFGGGWFLDDSMELIHATLTSFLSLIKGNWYMLVVTQSAVFPLFLVIGIALRTFSFTRKIGGLMIAMAVTLYFFHPGIVLLQSVLLSPDPNTFPVEFEQFAENVLPLYGKEIGGGTTTKWQSPFDFLYVKDEYGNQYDVITYYTFRITEPKGFIDTSAMITVWIVAQTVIMIYLVIIFIKELSPMFGGDVDIVGISRLL